MWLSGAWRVKLADSTRWAPRRGGAEALVDTAEPLAVGKQARTAVVSFGAHGVWARTTEGAAACAIAVSRRLAPSEPVAPERYDGARSGAVGRNGGGWWWRLHARRELELVPAERRRADRVQIEVLYFDGCPNHEALLPHLCDAVRVCARAVARPRRPRTRTPLPPRRRWGERRGAARAGALHDPPAHSDRRPRRPLGPQRGPDVDRHRPGGKAPRRRPPQRR